MRIIKSNAQRFYGWKRVSIGIFAVLAVTIASLGVSNFARAAAPAFVQVAAAVPQTKQSTVTVKYSKVQTAGNANILAIGWSDMTSTIASVTDSAGNTYEVGAPLARGVNESQAVYFAKNIKSSAANANTVTVTFSAAASYVDLRATEYSGLDTVAPLDKTAVASGRNGAATTPSVATTYDNELLFGAGITSDAFSAAGNGFTKRIITTPDADIIEDRAVGSTGSYNATAPQNGNWLMQLVTFKAAGAALDTVAPSVPTGLSVAATVQNQLDLTWVASTDNVGVAGYNIYRDGTKVATSTSTAYQDKGLAANTTHSYAVSATDAAGNESAKSATASGATVAASDFSFPTSISANRRYLLDQKGQPYMIVGDSPQSMGVNLTAAQTDSYFANRQSHGINAAWVQVLCSDYTGGRANGSTYDGILPFTTPGDFSTPNPVYFQRLVDMVNSAAQHGITVFLDPADMTGWLPQVQANGPIKNYNFGQYLGNLFKNAPNVLWLNGNDFQTWSNAADEADALAIANGIKATDPNHIQTVELNFTLSSSLDDPNWQPLIGLNAAYTYYPTYAEVLHAYNQTPTIPTFMVEANYESENGTGGPATTNETLRRQEYWTMLSGATGQFFGSHYTWGSPDWATEQAHLDSPMTVQLQYMANAFKSRAWYNLVPDQSHTFLTAGMGTFDSALDDVLQSDYATAAVTPDGALGMVYVPTARTITVNLGRMAGPITARWFDPSNNTYTAVNGSPFQTSSGNVQFTTPGQNADGNGDWVLVLDGNSVPDTTPPSVPSGLTVSGITSSAVSLSWAASTDDTGVAGYNIYRNGNLVGTTTGTTFNDGSLTADSPYDYNVAAFDFAHNTSAWSAGAHIVTSPAPTLATPAFVQTNNAVPQTPQNSVPVVFSQAQTIGNTNVIVVGFYNTAATISSVTDSAGNIYALAAPLTHSGSMYQAIYYASNIKAAAAGGNTVRVNFSGSVQYPDIRIAEYSGLDKTSPLDGTVSGTGTSSTATSGNLTTTAPGDLLVGAGTTLDVFNAAGSGYTLRVITHPNADIVEDRVAGAAGTYSATATGSGDHVMQLVAFKAASQ